MVKKNFTAMIVIITMRRITRNNDLLGKGVDSNRSNGTNIKRYR